MKRKRAISEISLQALSPEQLRRIRIAIIRAEYNGEITQSLESKCLEGLRKAGIRQDQIECHNVPGCFEIPLAAQRLAMRKRFDALIALGAVIRGETLHFDLVAGECARGVMEISLKFNLPVIFEVLATKNRRDAIARSGKNRLNKGFEAAQSALAALASLRRIEESN